MLKFIISSLINSVYHVLLKDTLMNNRLKIDLPSRIILGSIQCLRIFIDRIVLQNIKTPLQCFAIHLSQPLLPLDLQLDPDDGPRPKY